MVKARKQRRPQASFGAVSRINTAPVAVGNSIRGSKPRVTQTRNGARVVGRDFAFSLAGTAAAVTNWELIGGMPITPCALPSSILRNFCQMFANFRVNSLKVHYITSSPTSQAGDVLFYHEPKRFAPFPDYSNSNFLPFVLSDANTVIGPQWTNHTASVETTKEWKSTIYGQSPDMDEETAGTISLFSKTNAVNSPGYILIDYDISFKNMAVNPKAGSLPISRAQVTNTCMYFSNPGGGSNIATVISGNSVSGTAASAPSGAARGDIYKLVIQATASQSVNTWSGAGTLSNLFQYADGTNITLDDGLTFYVVNYDGTNYRWYATYDNARVRGEEMNFQTTLTASVYLCCAISLVSNVDSFQQSSY